MIISLDKDVFLKINKIDGKVELIRMSSIEKIDFWGCNIDKSKYTIVMSCVYDRYSKFIDVDKKEYNRIKEIFCLSEGK